MYPTKHDRLRAPSRRAGPRRDETAAGWLFISPMIIVLGLFLVLPVAMAAWVSVADWTGRGSPFSGEVRFVGADNFSALLSEPGLAQRDFGTSLRNNGYYVLLVVPLQTAVSMFLAVMLNRGHRRSTGALRTAFYFPSVTSSVAVTVLFLFLFSATGAVNRTLSYIGLNGPNWFADPRGVLHLVVGALGMDDPPKFLTDNRLLGVNLWEWLAGPSVAMCVFIVMAVFTTSGTFMLLFLSALQSIQAEIDEAATMDGASAWQRFRFVTLPMLMPTVFTVVTLGLIGTWQIFDQIYTGTQGGPAKTTMTPAYLSYTSSFNNQQWGQGAAIAFILFGIIVTLTIFQRLLLKDRTS